MTISILHFQVVTLFQRLSALKNIFKDPEILLYFRFQQTSPFSDNVRTAIVDTQTSFIGVF